MIATLRKVSIPHSLLSRKQMRKLTTSDFIERAKKEHGDKYDYDLSEYVSSKTPITIICPEHGAFSQRSSNHLSGIGCPKCGHEQTGLKKRNTHDGFVEKSKQVHHDKYDYSLSEYVSNKTPIRIICPEHGEFDQQPSNHLEGKGCPKCGQALVAEKRRDTLEEFIQKAIAIHGEKYVYPNQPYTNAHTKVDIRCLTHGLFSQAPTHHLSGTGCPHCGLIQRGLTRRRSTESFIRQAQSVHGDRYDYSQTNYVINRHPVQIICHSHGPFEQAPDSHLMGSNCPICAKEARVKALRMTFVDFVGRAASVHYERYKYKEDGFHGSESLVHIICPDHGPFFQHGGGHLSGNGCQKCGDLKIGAALRMSEKEFLRRARSVHGDLYEYDLSNLTNQRSNVGIICGVHGKCKKMAHKHLAGQGCPRCAYQERGVSQRKSADEFLVAARGVHGNKYDYSEMEYGLVTENVRIICPEHGPFEQSPSKHTSGQGCPSCAAYGFDAKSPAILYYLRVQDGPHTVWKIGITNRTIKERFSVDWYKITVVDFWTFDIGDDARNEEKKILREFRGERYRGENLLEQGGNTELFIADILGIDSEAPT